MRLATHLRTRRGFTLVEVLVAAGLCMLIMLMITTAFQRAMDTLSQLKSVGEMQQRLRAFETAVRGDLDADHFAGGSGPRVRDQRADTLNSISLANDTAPWRPAALGFFRIQQGKTGDGASATTFKNYGKSYVEGFDTDGNPSTRATDHLLHMTVKRNASRGDKVFSAAMPTAFAVNMNAMQSLNMMQMATTGNTVISDWAEVVYFLDTTNSIGNTPGGVPLYGLYRRTRILPGSGDPSTMSWNTLTSGMSTNDKVACQTLSHSAVTGMLNGPKEVRDPRNRLGGITALRGGTSIDNIVAETDSSGLIGSDLLVTDVISFEIKADWDGGTRAPGQQDATASLTLGNNLADRSTWTYEFPFSDLPETPGSRNTVLANSRVFDTWYDSQSDNWVKPASGAATGETLPQPMRLRAIQIKVRVWDRKNNMARQVTIVQDL
ncbi:hypothetical protein BH11PLA2_BH11PLA2_35690 [soil metagenome]